MQTFYLDPHNAKKKKRKKKKIGQLRIGLSHFLQEPIHHFVMAAVTTLGFLIGVGVFGVVTWQMVQFEYNFSRFGRDTTATIIGCEMVHGRGRTDPFVTYQYTVNGATYSDTWLAQFEYRDCAFTPNSRMINIVYLQNDPGTSIVGNTAEYNSDDSLALLFAVVGGGGVIAALKYSEHLLVYYLPPLWRWWNQAPYVVALPGEIVAVMEKGRRKIEVTYHYQSPQGKSRLGKAILSRRKHMVDNPPQVGMGVVVLYYSPDIVALA